MKKKFLTFILSICLIIPAIFMLSACSTTEDDNVQVRVQDGYVQWSSNDSDWQNVITIEDILDAIGDDITGPQGEQGVNGKQVEFNVSSTHIQWRYVGDSAWNDLIEIEDLKGDEGTDASYVTYTVNYVYGCIPTIAEQFSNYKTTQEIKSYEWITNMPRLEDSIYADDFLGWYIKGADRQVKEYDFIGGNVTLEAKWNTESSEIASRLCKGVNIVYENNTYVAYTLNEEEIIVPKYFDDGVNGEEVVTMVSSELYDHSNTNEVLMQEGLIKILPNSFRNSKIESIVIPASVTNIDYLAFFKCSKLLEINVNADNSVYDSRNNCNAIVETRTNKIIIGCKNTTIDNTIKIIGEDSFAYSSITTLNIPNNITEIEYGAFYDCNSLYYIWIPKSVEKMGANIFGRRLTQNYQSNYLLFVGCENSEKPELWNENWAGIIKDNETIVWNAKEQKKSEDFVYSVTNNNKVIIQRCISNKTNLVLTQIDGLDIIEIDNYALYGNDSLQEVNLESTAIEKLAKYSFYGCSNLKNIKLPSSLKYIEDSVFYYCDNLDYIFIDENSCLESVGSYNSNSLPAVCCKDVYNDNIDAVLPFNNIIYNFKELKQDVNYIYVVLNDNTIHIMTYVGERDFVLIDTIEDKNVSEIGYYAFYAYYAFENSNSVSTIYVKNNLTLNSDSNSYFSINYTKQENSDKEGYNMYTKNS